MFVNRVVFLLSLLGVQVAGYLTLAHLNLIILVCGRMRGCDQVANHPYAHGFGVPALSIIPTAAFGLLFFILLLALSWYRIATPSVRMAWRIGGLQWGLTFIGVLLSSWLTAVEVFVIHAFCPWCLVSAFIMFSIVLTLTLELLLKTRPSSSELPRLAPISQQRETARLTWVLVVFLLLDGSATLALRRTPPIPRVPISPAVITKKSMLIPAGSHLYGKASAPFTLVEFGDYACHYCQQAQPTLEQMLTAHPATLNYVFHYCPVADGPGPFSLAARAAEAAGRQGRFWEMHTRLFTLARTMPAPAGEVSINKVETIAGEIGLQRQQFDHDLVSSDTHTSILWQERLADTLRITSVPVFFIVDAHGKSKQFSSVKAVREWVDTPRNLQR